MKATNKGVNDQRHTTIPLGQRILWTCVLPNLLGLATVAAWCLCRVVLGSTGNPSGGGPSSDPSGLMGIASLLILLFVPLTTLAVTFVLSFVEWRERWHGFLTGLFSVLTMGAFPWLLNVIVRAIGGAG